VQLILQNEESADRRKVLFFLTSPDGTTPLTTIAAPLVVITLNGGTPVSGGTWTNVGYGMYALELSPALVEFPGTMEIRITDSNITPRFLPIAQTVQIVAFDPFSTPAFPETTVVRWGPSATEVGGTEAVDNAYGALVDIAFTGSADQYTIVWTDRAGPIPTADVTDAKMSLYKRDGTPVVQDAVLTDVSSIGAFTKNVVSPNRLPAQSSQILILTATIGGQPQVWRQPVTHP
jgi:hypothetical protein